MPSHMSLLTFGLTFIVLFIMIQSAPIGNNQQNELLSENSPVNQPSLQLADSNDDKASTSAATSTSANVISSTLPSTDVENKKKRDIVDGNADDDDDDLDQSDDIEDHALHTQMKETIAAIHDNAAHPVDTDDSAVYSDLRMSPYELSDIVRRRRDIQNKDRTNQRRKRALSPYELYDTDSLYNSLDDAFEVYPYVRPTRSFAPLYWYPSVTKRRVTWPSASGASKTSGWPTDYSAPMDLEDDDDDNLDTFEDDNDDENTYDINRYPLLLDTSKNPFDNLQLQQVYNNDDLPTLFNNDDDDDNGDDENNILLNGNNGDDEDDDDADDDDLAQYQFVYRKERPYNAQYAPFENYFEV